MDYQSFWNYESYALIGNSSKLEFPKLSYGKLKELGKKVYPIDPGVNDINGDKTYPDLKSLPEKVEAVIIEVPKKETKGWIEKAAEAGINNIWIHLGCDTKEAISLAGEKGMNLFYGTCAVMYLQQGFSYHSIHKWINKMLGKY